VFPPEPPVANTIRPERKCFTGPSLWTIFRINSSRFGMVHNDRTSPPCSATATAIVPAWTSRPTNSTLDMSDQFLSYAALRRQIRLFEA